ncbi:MAG: hypothetical protein ACYTFY_17500, partial [Planctomycetota bacterium]
KDLSTGINIIIEEDNTVFQSAYLSLAGGKLAVEDVKEDAERITVDKMTAAAILFGPLKPSYYLQENVPAWLDAVLPLVVNIPALYKV